MIKEIMLKWLDKKIQKNEDIIRMCEKTISRAKEANESYIYHSNRLIRAMSHDQYQRYCIRNYGIDPDNLDQYLDSNTAGQPDIANPQ